MVAFVLVEMCSIKPILKIEWLKRREDIKWLLNLNYQMSAKEWLKAKS